MPPTPPETETEPEFAEVNPTGRYGRVMPLFPSPDHPPRLRSLATPAAVLTHSALLQYTEVLGKGAFKTVYPSIPPGRLTSGSDSGPFDFARSIKDPGFTRSMPWEGTVS